MSRLIERAPETRLRAIAAYYLGLSKGAKDVQLLTRALEDTSGQARWFAASSRKSNWAISSAGSRAGPLRLGQKKVRQPSARSW